MKKLMVILLIVVAGFILTACSMNEYPASFPYFEYTASDWRVDYRSRYIDIREGYMLDPAHSYDEVETETGYDCVFHMIPNEN